MAPRLKLFNTHSAKNCDFRSCSAPTPVLFWCRRRCLKDSPAETPVCRASTGPCIAKEKGWPHRPPTKISRSNTFSTVAGLSVRRNKPPCEKSLLQRTETVKGLKYYVTPESIFTRRFFFLINYLSFWPQKFTNLHHN